jgi:hypothetical protein
MDNTVELLSLNCASCGASLENFQNQSEVKCDFCDNTTQIVRPIRVDAASSAVIEGADATKFDNLISIMEQSMVAGNYKEAYDYCNKGLEIDPKLAALWENKAICSFWIRTDSEIINSEAKEILTYLNAAKAADPDSPSLSHTSKSLASNLYFAVYYKYFMMDCDASSNGKDLDQWTEASVKTIIDYMNIMELCFNIDPTVEYLDTAVKELTNLEKCHWIDPSKKGNVTAEFVKSLRFDAVKTRAKYIKKIKELDPNYAVPKFEDNSGCFIATATMGDYDHPVVMDLRVFRDEWLNNQSWGQSFISFYYRYGPIPARIIKDVILLRRFSYALIVKPLHLLAIFLLGRNK